MSENGKGKEENEEKLKKEWMKIREMVLKKLRTPPFFFFLLFTFMKRLKLLRGLPKWKFLPRKA